MEAKKQSEGGLGVLYTGVAMFNVIAVNPTQQELQAMGYKAEKPPTYLFTKEDNGKKYQGIRISFICETEIDGEKLKAPYNVFMVAKKSVSNNGKTEYMDKYGKSIYATDENDLRNFEYIDHESAKHTVEGMPQLLKFLRVLLGLGKEDTASLRDGKKIFTGDVSEIRQYVKDAKILGNNVKLLMGVKDGKYQEFYEFPMYPNTISMEILHKIMKKEKAYIKIDFGQIDYDNFNQNDFMLKKYSPSTNFESSESAPAEAYDDSGENFDVNDSLDDLFD